MFRTCLRSSAPWRTTRGNRFRFAAGVRPTTSRTRLHSSRRRPPIGSPGRSWSSMAASGSRADRRATQRNEPNDSAGASLRPEQHDATRRARELVLWRRVPAGVVLDAVQLRRVHDVDVGFGNGLAVEKELHVTWVVAEAGAWRRGSFRGRLARTRAGAADTAASGRAAERDAGGVQSFICCVDTARAVT